MIDWLTEPYTTTRLSLILALLVSAFVESARRRLWPVALRWWRGRAR